MGSEAVGVAVDVEHDALVEEPVQHGGCDGGVGEDVSPRGDAAVRSQDDRAFEIPACNNLVAGGSIDTGNW